MKRGNINRGIVLTGAMVSVMALSACQSDTEAQVGGRVFESMEACLSAAPFTDQLTSEMCQEGFDGAIAEHERAAPRYSDTATCEEIHGAGNCVARTDSDGGSFLLPMMAGYLIGNSLSNMGRPMYYDGNDRSRYLLNNGSAGYSTVDRRPGWQRVDSRSAVAPTSRPSYTSVSQARPASGFPTARPAPVARSTGGFGAARTGGTSFGG